MELYVKELYHYILGVKIQPHQMQISTGSATIKKGSGWLNSGYQPECCIKAQDFLEFIHEELKNEVS